MKSPLELFRRLEREVRLATKRLPIDAFLPALDSLPTEFPDPPPSAIPSQSREMGDSLESDEDRRERRRARRAKKPAPPPEGGPPAKLEDEIQEFMNRDKREGTRPDEIAEFLGGFDPSEGSED
ncbi:MAG TPA: hypothetical protein VGR38_03010 [Candidatus Polarisedimenticolia bacterium]|jgi:hypothetical protein|nr:hypothetical protein [Candidatus Polarisedimenticolia bacterium]